MATLAPIQGSMVLDPSAYIAGLNQAAGATRSFQQGVSTISFAGFNRGIFATTTLLYGLERIISRMSQGMEEYANMLGRIGTVADLTAASVAALAESMKSVSVMQGVSRRDIMGGMYTAAQAGYGTPAEMRAMSMSGAKLSRASGKEIDVKKSVDLMSGIRQALGIGSDAISSNRMTDILLRGRDVGRWELDQMAHALGIPLTVWGNQFAGKQSGEETLRQLVSVMSVASLAGVSPNMTATGTRRIVEKTLQLNKSGKMADPLRNALRGQGFNGPEPIMEALNQGGMKYLNTLMKITGGSSGELTRMGYGSRDLLVLTSALRGQGAKLNQTYEELAYGNTAGTTERYAEKMRGTYDYTRDRLRSQWEITSQQFMQASIPLIGQFTNMLEGFNKVAQALPESVKSFMMLMSAMSAARLFLNFFGFRVGKAGGAGGMAGMAGSHSVGSKMSSPQIFLPGGNAQAARLARRQNIAAGRPYSRYLTPQSSTMWQGTSPLSGSVAPSSLSALSWLARQPKYGIAEEGRIEALRNRYAPMTSGGIPMSSSKYGPTLEQRIRWAAYKQGQSVDFGTGSYGSLSPTVQGYFAGRGRGEGTASVAVWNQMQNRLHDINSAAYSRGGRPGAPSQWQGFGGGLRYMGGELRQDMRNISFAPIMSSVSAVTGSLRSFGASLMGTIGPLLKFSAIVGIAGKIYEGIVYRGREGEKRGGQDVLAGGNQRLGLLRGYGEQMKLLGTGAWKGGGKYTGDAIEELARTWGFEAADPGKGMGVWESIKTIGNPLLAGYRRKTLSDVMGMVGRENLTPLEARKFQKGGIDFSDFGTAKGYLNDYVQNQLGNKAPESWSNWMRNTEGGADKLAQYITDALKYAGEKIAKAADVAAGRIAAPSWTGPWGASVSQTSMDAALNQRILSGRQWDIYSGADYSGRGNGGLNWGAGGKDYRAMYDKELGNLDTRFGGFDNRSWSAGIRSSIEGQRKTWQDKASVVGAKFGGFKDDKVLSYMLGEGDKDFAKNQKLREFLKVMPDIGTVPEAEAMAWFSKMTGRDPMTDVYAKANFDNFRNMNVADYVTAEQVRPPTQYASATQFGTAEAYNQLLQRDNPTEKLNIAIDKLATYFETFTVTKEQAETELQKVTKAAAKFFEDATTTNFFQNVQDMAVDAGE